MAFKRTSFGSLNSNKKTFFGSEYKFSKKVDFKEGREVYVIPLGLETGYYETPCHKVSAVKIDGQMRGLGGLNFTQYIKCNGIDADGNKTESLCCELAKKEKERLPEKDDSAKRIISFTTNRIHLPVLILGNSLPQGSNKAAYPVTKVSILNSLNSEDGLNFAYLEFASSVFSKDIVGAYASKLRDEGALDYDLEEGSEEFYEEIRKRLVNTVIKIRGVSKKGFNAALKEYSFFPFSNPAIAKDSPEGEREAIVNYKENKEIVAKIDEFLGLFDKEVDDIVKDCDDKELLEYYNAVVQAISPSSTPKKEEEKIEIINQSVKEETPEVSAESAEEKELLDSIEDFSDAETVTTDEDDFSFDADEEEDFFGEEA